VKLRHAAAFALAGWYLMLPPLEKPNAPLSQWKILARVDSEAECQGERKGIMDDAENDETGDSALVTFETSRGEKQFIARAAVCVAASDPRLRPIGILHRLSR